MTKLSCSCTRRGALIFIAAGLGAALAACADGSRPPPPEFYRRGRQSRGGGARDRRGD